MLSVRLIHDTMRNVENPPSNVPFSQITVQITAQITEESEALRRLERLHAAGVAYRDWHHESANDSPFPCRGCL